MSNLHLKRLQILDADQPTFEKELTALVDAMIWADARGDQFIFITAGLTDDQIEAYLPRQPFPIPQLVKTHYPSTASMTLRDAQATGKKVHVLIGKPVQYEPTASVFTFGGLPIPAVFDEELGPVLAAADTVTICVKSHA